MTKDISGLDKNCLWWQMDMRWHCGAESRKTASATVDCQYQFLTRRQCPRPQKRWVLWAQHFKFSNIQAILGSRCASNTSTYRQLHVSQRKYMYLWASPNTVAVPLVLPEAMPLCIDSLKGMVTRAPRRKWREFYGSFSDPSRPDQPSIASH